MSLIENSAYVEALQSEYDRLRELLDRRPAMNAGLVETYAKWSGDVYVSDFQHCAGFQRAIEDLKRALGGLQ